MHLRFQTCDLCQQIRTFPFQELVVKLALSSSEMLQGWVMGVADKNDMFRKVI
jgi:hypothetical protein